ncbi:MAG: hypothetical protein MJE66_14775 [Proteobacteria bacterium]|nr:hypothetical protein [Pseudomonadota bacterium]
MYDEKNEAREFVSDTREEAVAKAVTYFGREASELTIGEFDEGDVFGLGGRIVVVAQPSDRPAPRRDAGDRDRERGDRGERGGRGDRRGGRGRGRERGERADRGERGERGGRSERKAAPTEPSKGTIEGEASAVGEFVLGVVERMDVGPFELSENRDGELLVVQIRGAAARELGSGDGRAVDALQLLAGQAAVIQDDDAPRVVVDAEGDPERRESFLTRLGERAARRARDTSRSVALDPMNGKDRRIIHMALRDAEGVATMSVGEGRYRQVVVVPEASPEYADAKRASEAAAERD